MNTEQLLREHLFGDKFFDYKSLTLVDPHKKLLLREANANNIKRVVMHCTDAPSWSPQKLSEFFVNERQFPICAYHYYIMADKIYQMVGENIITYHAAPYNTESVSFSIDFFASNYESRSIAVLPEVYENALKVATYLCLKFKVQPKNLVGHRELLGTGFFMNGDKKVLRKICPGLTIDLDVFRYKVARMIQEALNFTITDNVYATAFGLSDFNQQLSVDGVFGAKTIKAFNGFVC
jgi:hypothetical protein